MKKFPYSKSVFINCPFTKDFDPIHNALIFAVFAFGFIPRSAREVQEGSDDRLGKIQRIISESMYGIHDLSYLKLDPITQLPRLNMTFELGLFLGAKRYGDEKQNKKRLLILDSEKFRLGKALSDWAGRDPEVHNNDPQSAIRCVRTWLQPNVRNYLLTGADEVWKDYQKFQSDIPQTKRRLKMSEDEILTYLDFWQIIFEWHKETQ